MTVELIGSLEAGCQTDPAFDAYTGHAVKVLWQGMGEGAGG